jgi:hypothetical protein
MKKLAPARFRRNPSTGVLLESHRQRRIDHLLKIVAELRGVRVSRVAQVSSSV